MTRTDPPFTLARPRAPVFLVPVIQAIVMFAALVARFTTDAPLGFLPTSDALDQLDAALGAMERTLIAGMLPPGLAAVWEEMEAGASLEARIVKAADKLQMMIKAYQYGRQQRGFLEEFWLNPKNFDDRGVPLGNLPRDDQGRVVCPAHGLRWDLGTGRLCPMTDRE